MIRLIFCKIWDEKYNVDSIPEFRVIPNEPHLDVKKRIVGLFNSVKSELVDD